MDHDQSITGRRALHSFWFHVQWGSFICKLRSGPAPPRFVSALLRTMRRKSRGKNTQSFSTLSSQLLVVLHEWMKTLPETAVHYLAGDDIKDDDVSSSSRAPRDEIGKVQHAITQKFARVQFATKMTLKVGDNGCLPGHLIGVR